MKKFFTILCFLLICSSLLTAKTGVVPDKPGMNIKGTILADGKPLGGVIVSDGEELTSTDADGNYWLASSKRNGWVYVSIPSGYEVPCKHSLPQFWASLTKEPGEVEQHDFSLKKVNQDKYILLGVTDMHLASIHYDLEQFCTKFIPRITNFVKSANVPCYSLNLGDMSFDIYWYDYRYAIEQYAKAMGIVNYPTPLFHVPGNHDHDGGTPYSDSTDFLAIRRYCKVLGPNYYSFNIGKEHIIMLDNIIYINAPGGKKAGGIVGARNITTRVTPDQLAWLKKDLATIKDKSTPIIVGMHAPAYHYKDATDSIISWFSKPEYSEELAKCFEGFKEVHFVSGHTHYCNTTYVNEHLTEHNIGAVSGCWWKTGEFYGQDLCPNGGPAGFEVFRVNGKNISWQFYGTDEGGGKQFRTYDINSVKDYYGITENLKAFTSHYPDRDFTQKGNDLVYINIWDWAPDWKISVTENGKRLEVVHEMLEDPLYTISMDLISTRKGEFPQKLANGKKNHMFRVQASSPSSTLEITVTDHFGREYHETMRRPKAFGLLMK